VLTGLSIILFNNVPHSWAPTCVKLPLFLIFELRFGLT